MSGRAGVNALLLEVEILKLMVMLIFWGTLSSVDVGDKSGAGGEGACAKEGWLNTGMGMGISEVSLVVNQPCLNASLLPFQLNLLPLNSRKFIFMGTEMGDVSDDAGILKVDECV